MTLVRYCVNCDDEFRPDIQVCTVCNSPLILQEEGLGAPADREATVETSLQGNELDSWPLESLRRVASLASIEEAESAIAPLAQANIPSRILVQNGVYIVLIRPEDMTKAAEIAHAAAQAVLDVNATVDPSFDATALRYKQCPACQASLSSAATECPECGLQLGSGDATPADLGQEDA